jgi:hypothetical protein
LDMIKLYQREEEEERHIRERYQREEEEERHVLEGYVGEA